MINTILQGDVIERLKDIKANTIQCVVTSPPYWGLRDYGTATWIGGDEDCKHNILNKIKKIKGDWDRPSRIESNKVSHLLECRVCGITFYGKMNKKFCSTKCLNTLSNNSRTNIKPKIIKKCQKCGAIRKDKQLGLEETFEEYVENMVKVFREVRKVLKDDGTLWLNLGDSYAGNCSRASNNGRAGYGNKREGIYIKSGKNIKPKDLVGIPWRVALALQADGWYLRQDIIWHKPNPMPESVTDRCTKSHEYIFLLTKSANYYYDADAIREPIVHYGNNKTNNLSKADIYKTKKDVKQKPYAVIEPQFRKEVIEYRDLPNQEEIRQYLSIARKKRNITIKQIEEHFGNQAGHHWFEKNGSYPSVEDWKVLKDMLKLDGTYDKVMTKVYYKSGLKQDNPLGANKRSVWKINTKPYKEAHFAVFPEELPTLCIKAGSKKGDIVLDPFFGSGTTGYVAQRLYRKWLGIELNKDYIKIAEKRFVQQELF